METLIPGQHGGNITDDNFKYNLTNENVNYDIFCLLKSNPTGVTNDKTPLL